MSGGVNTLANTRVKTDANGYLLVTIGGGTISASLIPATDNTYDLGTAALRWATGYFVSVTLNSISTPAATSLGFNVPTSFQHNFMVNSVNKVVIDGSQLYPSADNAYALGAVNQRWSTFFGTAIVLSGKTTTYNSITTAGQGVPSIYAAGSVAAQTTVAASICTYTTPAADGDYEVSGNVNVTASGTHSFSLNCAYTDEGGTARTLIIPVAQLAGAFVASGLITNITGVGPYESAAMHIRCKQTTAITIGLSAGTFTSVTYNARAAIRQLQ